MGKHNLRSGLTRRSLLKGALGGAATLSLSRPARAQPRPAVPGVPYGAAIQSDYMDDESYVQAFLDECDMIVPMNELKFLLVHPERGEYDFSRADRIVDLARANRRTSRGHTFVWYNTNPAWVEAIEDPVELERVLVDHVETVADHFAGRLEEWDVVNEVVANDPTGLSNPLRDTFWLRKLGPRHIPVAFEAAARADPSARLLINDYDLEFAGPAYDLKRAAILDIVRQLQDRNIKIDGVGMQAHLYAHQSIDTVVLARFFEDLRALGLGISITELDVIDFQIRGGVDEQDAAAGAIVSDLLDALETMPPSTVVTWGITDRYNWVEDAMPRDDGNPTRPLPFDAQLRPKAWYPMLRDRLTKMRST